MRLTANILPMNPPNSANNVNVTKMMYMMNITTPMGTLAHRVITTRIQMTNYNANLIFHLKAMIDPIVT